MPERSVLHGYFRSSAAYRVRIALNLKGIEAERRPVHLRKGEQRSPDFLPKGEQRSPDFLHRNPAGLVPLWTEAGWSLWMKPIPSRPCCPARPATGRASASWP